MARPKKQLPEPLELVEQVKALAAVGLTAEEIATVIRVSTHQVREGQLSEAYKEGRANGKKSLLAAQYRRALNDEHGGCVTAADKLLKMVHHMAETQAIDVTGNPITLILTPDDPNPSPATSGE